MKLKRTMQAVAIMAATGSCFLSPQEATLTLEGIGQEDLAGLRLFIGGDIFPDLDDERGFTATELADTLQFGVPDHGTAAVTALVVQDGRVVAEGTREWGLEPEVEWTLYINRGLHSAVSPVGGDLENPECAWWWCHRVWRFPIVEDAANYEDEALWLYLVRVHPDECQDVCYSWWL